MEKTSGNKRGDEGLEGLVVFGKYRVIGLVERRKIGRIYAAERIATNEMVAVQFLNKKLLKGEILAKKLKQEIKELINIRHPNINEIYDFYIPSPQTERLPFIITELIVGHSLDETLGRNRKIDIKEAVTIIRQVLDSLTAIHDAGIIHHCLNPKNIFLSVTPGEEARVKLVDAGFAGPLIARIEHGDMGLLDELEWDEKYSAPEFFTGGSLTERSDVFSCGMLLMRMLTGKLPDLMPHSSFPWMKAESDTNDRAEIPRASIFNPVIPKTLDDIIFRATKKTPEERYMKASEMHADIEMFSAEMEPEKDEAALPLDKPEELLRLVRIMEEKISDGTYPEHDPEGGATADRKKVPAVMSKASPAGHPRGFVAKAFSSLGIGMGIGVVFFTLLAIVFYPSLLDIVYVKAEHASATLFTGGLNNFALKGTGMGGNEAAGKAGDESGAEAGEEAGGEETENEMDSEKSRPENVRIVVMGAPYDALVVMGDKVLTGHPPKVDVQYSEETVKLEIQARGYEKYKKKIKTNRDRNLVVTLKKISELEQAELAAGVEEGEAEQAEKKVKTRKKKKKKKKRKKKYILEFVD